MSRKSLRRFVSIPCLGFGGFGLGCVGVWSLGLGRGLGARRKSRASLPKQRRLGSGNVSGKLAQHQRPAASLCKLSGVAGQRLQVRCSW